MSDSRGCGHPRSGLSFGDMSTELAHSENDSHVSSDGALLDIRNLKLEFGTPEKPLRAVDDVSFTIKAGETVCVVGESGCGKSVTALSIARLVPTPPARYVGGEILLNGQNVLRMSKSQLREIRGGVVSYIFQEP